MAWDHLSINKPHLVYIILGGFTSLFMLCSSFVKERLYIGEATVATICGVIFGPHAANLINPGTWGNTDQITLEFSRIVLVVQCFAVGVELPKYYMEKHWRSVVFLLIPVMTFGWLITSLFIWWMIPTLNWLESLCVAACVTATDPVLASSVVGKGKFAKKVPKHLRDILSAESGCNDGMAFPFIYLALYLIDFRPDADKVTFNWMVITILYECVFGAIFGFLIGLAGRHGIRLAERYDLVDRESFLVFYFVLALFCAGAGSILGVDDLLVGFAAGVGFSNDGWFTQKTEESHVSNVIDLLLNLAYFVYLGTIIPWEQYNMPEIGTTPWRLVVIALFVIFFRRIPIMMALKPLIPDVKTWREALFAGHFGPIGVGAIFVAILARAELETETTTPLASYPTTGAKNAPLVALIWPITTFLVISSIIVHGSSIAVFTLGRHINTLTLTMSYTTAGEDGPGWLNRLPRITSTSRSQAKSFTSETDVDRASLDEQVPPGTLPPVGIPRQFLRRQKEDEKTESRSSSVIPRRRKKRWDDGLGPGGPITQSAIYPQRLSQGDQHRESTTSDTLTPGQTSPENEKDVEEDEERYEGELGELQHDPEMEEIMHRDSDADRNDLHMSKAERDPDSREVYQEGHDIIVENEDGDVLGQRETEHGREKRKAREDFTKEIKEDVEHQMTGYKNLRKKLGVWRHKDELDPDGSEKPRHKQPQRKRGPALAYQFGNTIIVEDEDGEVVKTYALPKAEKQPGAPPGAVRQGITRVGTGLGLKSKPEPAPGGESSNASAPPNNPRQHMNRMGSLANWGFHRKETPPNGEGEGPNDQKAEADDDRHIRFTIGGAGRRLTKDDFLKEIQSLDPKARCEVIADSDAPAAMKAMARKDADKNSPGSSRLFGANATGAKTVQAASGKEAAKAVGAEMAKKRGAKVEEGSSGDDSPHAARRDGRGPPKIDRVPEEEETAAERKRRQKALRGVDEEEDARRPESSRGRSHTESAAGKTHRGRQKSVEVETAAEKRRREAALGFSGDHGGEDSEDDDTPRVPPPAAKPRGIRFAQSPARGERAAGKAPAA